MLRHLVLVVSLWLLASLGVTASFAQSPPDWDFEAGGAGWSAVNGRLELGGPAHSGASAGRLVATSTHEVQLRGAVPLDGTGAGDTLTVSAWVRADPSEVDRVQLHLEALSSAPAVLRGRAASPPATAGYSRVEVSLVLPPDVASARVRLAAVPARLGAGVLVDGVTVTTARTTTPPGAGTVSSPTPTSTPTPLGTPPVTPSPTRTPTPSPTATAAAVPAVFGTLVNGDFEDARGLYAWAAQGGSATLGRGRTGAIAVLTSSSSSTKWLQQAVRVSPGEWYSAAAWLAPSPGSEAWLRVAWYASEDATGSQLSVDDSPGPPGGGGVVAMEAVRAPAEAHSARVRLMVRPASAATATLEADDVRFGPAEARATATPSPSATPTPMASIATAAPTVPLSAGANGRGAPPGALEGPPVAGGVATHPVAGAMAAGPAGGEPLAATGARGTVLRITEVMADPSEPGPDADYEWFEVANLAREAANLEGYVAIDNAGAVSLPALTLEAGGVLVLRASRADVGAAVLVHTFERGFSNGLGNAGDRLALQAPGGVTVDAVSWGSDRTHATGLPELTAPPAGRSILRRFTDDGSFVDATHSANPSPGRIEDSLAPLEHPAPAHLATLAPSASRGWLLLLGLAAAALALAGVERGWRVVHASKAG